MKKNYRIQEIVTLILTKKMKCFQLEVYFSISRLLCFLNLSYIYIYIYIFNSFPFTCDSIGLKFHENKWLNIQINC